MHQSVEGEGNLHRRGWGTVGTRAGVCWDSAHGCHRVGGVRDKLLSQ